MLNCTRLISRSNSCLKWQALVQRGQHASYVKSCNSPLQVSDFCENAQHAPLARSMSTGVLQSQDVGMFKKALKRFAFVGGEKSRLKMGSFVLYENVADKINYAEFFDEFNMPDTFNSWFLITELHVWMLLMRAMAEGSESGEDGRFIRNSIVEAMWADVNTRAKKLGAANPSGTRAQIEVLSEQFQAALIAYDEGIMSDDKILAGSIWRRFFERKCNAYDQLERLVIYVRQQVKMLDTLSRQEFVIKPNIRWIPLSQIKC